MSGDRLISGEVIGEKRSLRPGIAVVLGLGLGIVDVFVYRTNLSILYPMVILLLINSRSRSITAVTAFLVLLTFIGYLTKFYIVFHEPFRIDTLYRFFNRSLVALSIIATDRW